MSGPDYAGPARDEAPVDALCSVLADGRRRQVLRHLQSGEEPVATVDGLVERLADARPAEERARLAARFHHVTLPTLAEAGFVDCDARTGTVAWLGPPLPERLLGAGPEVEATR